MFCRILARAGCGGRGPLSQAAARADRPPPPCGDPVHPATAIRCPRNPSSRARSGTSGTPCAGSPANPTRAPSPALASARRRHTVSPRPHFSRENWDIRDTLHRPQRQPRPTHPGRAAHPRRQRQSEFELPFSRANLVSSAHVARPQRGDPAHPAAGATQCRQDPTFRAKTGTLGTLCCHPCTHARETTPRYDASRPPHAHDRKG